MTNSKIEQVLIDNNFEICKTPEGQNNLMKSVSLALFNTIDHYEKIQQYCKKYIKHLIEQKLLSKKLEGFIQNERWVADYFTNPTLKCFERLNLELLSLIFKTKITIFTISQEHQFLKSTIYNNGFDHGIINLYQPDQKHYDVFRHKNSPILPMLDQALISDILGDLKDQPNGATLKDDQHANHYQIYGVTESPQIPGQKRHSFHRKHKKSLSDTFNPFQIRVPNDFLDLFKGSNDFSNNSQFLSLINHHQSNSSSTGINSDLSNHHHDPTQNIESTSRRLKYQNYIDETEETLNVAINNTQLSKFNPKANENSSSPNSYNLSHQLNPEQPTQFTNNANSNQLLNPEKSNEENQQTLNLNNQMNGFQQSYLQNNIPQTQQLNSLSNTNAKQDTLNTQNLAQSNNQSNLNTSGQQQNNLAQNNLSSNTTSLQTKIAVNQGESLAISSQSSNESLNSNQVNNQGMQDSQISQQQQIQASQTSNQQQASIQQSSNTPNLLSTPSIDFIQFTHPIPNMVPIPTVSTPNLLTPPFMPPPATINLLNPSFDQLQKLPANQLTKSMSYSITSTTPQLQQQNTQQQQQQIQQNTSQSQQQQQQQAQGSQISANAIHENLRRYMGSLKFFDENKNYGFIVMDDDNRDIFVHYDDLQKAGITKEFLKSSKQGNVIRFSFSCMQYIGKYKQSKKAVELQVMPYNPALSALRRQQFSYISANPQNTSNNNQSNNNSNL
ncbi:cold-shock DNA-binding domain protein (macronuclear) [Tetrahymena thermophila SB210]|uniref:Cold-shock DNA-binding domain protein n=1 Tax=Tetrahymena thermophila (strain SB210) TaxID=312017 RepID=I7M9X1_TETTS|nr:cold-shock DNA-binding domain protein [Tetrahymena thermophila SB210]EAS02977.1 cold-shock DNA-binding domain protein [Tetrahymena thermophila SB210]|eukprot:XP_001023222.1 cold-shock DNA-binding domain protein [Tetrahymena thermophila SB210]